MPSKLEMLAELAKKGRSLTKGSPATGRVPALVNKISDPARTQVLPMPNRWFLEPDKFPHVQPLVEKVLKENNMQRGDFFSGAFVDPKTGKILDFNVMKDVGVVIDPATNRPKMSGLGSDLGSFMDIPQSMGPQTKSNLVRKGLFKTVGGDPLLNDINFLATVERSGAGHQYGLGTEYATPTEMLNTMSGDNPTLRPHSRGDLFGVGDVVGKIVTPRGTPTDVYESLLIAPSGSDVEGVRLHKKQGGAVNMGGGGRAVLGIGQMIKELASKGSSNAAPQITKKAKEFFSEGDLPKPKENHVRIFRGSWEREPKYIVEENPRHDVYGGVFGSSGLKVAKSHGNQGLHYTDIPQDKILTHYDLNYEIPYEKTKAALLKAQPHLADDPELFDDVYKIVVEDAGQDLRSLNDDLVERAFGDRWGADNEAQRIRGQVSKNLGYQAVEMVDEHGGGTYLVSPGAEFQTLENIPQNSSKFPVDKFKGGAVSQDAMRLAVMNQKVQHKVKGGRMGAGLEVLKGVGNAIKGSGKPVISDKFNLINLDTRNIARDLGIEARIAKQRAVEAEGRRKEAAKIVQTTVGYRQSTPLKPDPLEGQRYVAAKPTGIITPPMFDPSKHIGANTSLLDWDSITRNSKVSGVSGYDLPVEITTPGGYQYALDEGHIAKGVAGASGKEIAKRVADRINISSAEGANKGGTGEALSFVQTMGGDAENFSSPIPQLMFDMVNHRLMEGRITKADADYITKLIKTRNPKVFGDTSQFAGFNDMGWEQFHTGEGLTGTSPGALRTAISDVAQMESVQKLLDFNIADFKNAIIADKLRDVPKGNIGSVVIRAPDRGVEVIPNPLFPYESPYSTNFTGTGIAQFPKIMNSEALFYRALNPIKEELLEKGAKIPYTAETLHRAALGAMGKRKENISQMIDPQFVDDYGTYLDELSKPNEYKDGGVVHMKDGNLVDELINEAKKKQQAPSDQFAPKPVLRSGQSPKVQKTIEDMRAEVEANQRASDVLNQDIRGIAPREGSDKPYAGRSTIFPEGIMRDVAESAYRDMGPSIVPAERQLEPSVTIGRQPSYVAPVDFGTVLTEAGTALDLPSQLLGEAAFRATGSPLASTIAAYGPSMIGPEKYVKGAKALRDEAAFRIHQAMTTGQGPLAGALAGVAPRQLITYHGTPHRMAPTKKNPLGEFDPAKIGTGQGAQTYGEGHYLAEVPDVAKIYQPRDLAHEQELLKLYTAAEKRGDYSAMEILENAMTHKTPEELRGIHGEAGEPVIKQIDKIPRTVGALYKVDLPDEHIANMIDYDKPINEQTPEVKALLEKAGINIQSSAQAGTMIGGQEMTLAKHGIPGVKYFDERSRDAGEGTRNFVVFPGNEHMMDIVGREKDGGVVRMAGGGKVGALKALGEIFVGGAKVKIRPPSDNVANVRNANFQYPRTIGNQNVSIGDLKGGVRFDKQESQRVNQLAAKIASPEGYISRIIVDHDNNVVEGQHRLEALRQLGAKEVPVYKIEDLADTMPVAKMESAIQSIGAIHSDHVHQLMQHVLNDIAEHGIEGARQMDAGAFQKFYDAALDAASRKAPQEDALRLAQERAALPVDQGGLGLPAGNTAEQRAAAMGIKTDAYHGTKQNITGAFKPGYDDNLGFVTKDPEFANNWIGKGKIQQRADPEAKAELKAAEDLYKAIKEKNMDYGSIDLKSPDFHDVYEKRNDAFKKAFNENVGLYPDKTHSTVYPLKVQANNTFDPETNMDVMAEFFAKNNVPLQNQELYKSGNYLMYETKPVVNFLKSKGYDSMRLRESTGDDYPTIAVFNPETIRSRFAAFDPFRRDAAIAASMGVAAPDLLAAEPEKKAKGGPVSLDAMRLALQNKQVQHKAGGGKMEALRAIGRGYKGMREPVKPKSITKEGGGNWLAGSVEGAMSPLKGSQMSPEDIALANKMIANGNWNPELAATQKRRIEESTRNAPLNQWIDKQLTRYVKNQMATKEDPIRVLAEKGTLHVNPEQLNFNPESYGKYLGAGQKVVAQSPTAKSWEGVSDLSISPMIAKQLLGNDGTRMGRGDSILENNPWLNKVPEETSVYSMTDPQGVPSDLGFDHLIDELRNATNPASGLPRELLIKPESLSKLSVPQAVERVAKINEWRAAQKAEADVVRARNPATFLHKDYPDKGYSWQELRMPEGEKPADWNSYTPAEQKNYLSLPNKQGEAQLVDALKYEGETMGHCVGGYCPDVMEGRSRIYSLRDAKGQPHVTIETQPAGMLRNEDFGANDVTIKEGTNDFGDRGYNTTDGSFFESYSDAVDHQQKIAKPIENMPSRITQIKGKGNKKPNEEYLPFVQDFVKSGKWSDVGDFYNTGLMRIAPESNEALYLQKQNKPIPEYVSDQEYEEIRRGMADAMRSPYGAADEMKEGGVAHLDKGGAPETPEQELQRYLQMLRVNAIGGKDQYGSSVGGRFGLNIPVSENVSIEPYVQGFAFKPDSGKLMNRGAGGANLNIRFNNGGKVSQDAMRLAVMNKQLRKHHG